MNLSVAFFVAAAALSACLVGWFFLRRRQLRDEAVLVHERQAQERTLRRGASQEDFIAAWLRAHEPRSVAYMALAILGLGIVFPLASILVNTVWRWFWINTPMIEAIEPGSIIQVFFGAVIVIAITVATVAWPLMRRYQSRRPGKFETELERELRGDAT